MLWNLPVSHALYLTKFNYQLDEGPKLSWDYTSEMSKHDTAHPLTQGDYG